MCLSAACLKRRRELFYKRFRLQVSGLDAYSLYRKPDEFSKSAFEPHNVEQGISNRRSADSKAVTSKFSIRYSTFCGSKKPINCIVVNHRLWRCDSKRLCRYAARPRVRQKE
jgi:hypothetical protein